jgi:hypothetical protein
MLAAISGAFMGWADAVEGSRDAVQRIEEGIAVPRFVALESFMPWYLAMLAEAQAAIGRDEEARATLDEALASVRRAGANFYGPELHRLVADLTSAAGGDRVQVKSHLETARLLARAQGARWWELRIATDRCRLLGASRETIDELAAARAAVVGGEQTPVVEAASAVAAGTL